MKIVVIGAGQGGMVAAQRLAAGGVDVTVYEKHSRENLGYDWHDDVNPKVFSDLGIPMPDKSKYFTKGNWSFYAPFSTNPVKINLEEDKLDKSMDRRALNQTLISFAENAGAKFVFDAKVESLIIEGDSVLGIVVNGGTVFADLVIDSSGAESPFRSNLPERFNITQKVDKMDMFEAYRGFHKRIDGVELDKVHTNKVYLKHLGKLGISWCIADPSGTLNVLIGHLGELSKEDFDECYANLKKENPALSDDVVHGGIKVKIPVRYPLSRMVANGYVVIGDAAFMTIPMLGSGIESSMRAADMLGRVIVENDSVSVETLWKYQAQFFKKIGLKHVSIDILKRWLLGADIDDINFLFDNGVVSDQDMSTAATGDVLTLGFKQILEKVAKGYKKLFLLLKLNGILTKGKKASKHAANIPAEYDAEKIMKWQNKLEGFFK